ncbi:MAG: Gfo/Idh/MocA family oxidoreductase [Elusimicrobia bacterium]|nr:Gfo/Idh/MocA family oxidoreductase [Elusimicrobiota bacterium]
MAEKVRIAVIGLGHWGPNYLRNFSQMDTSEVVACADKDTARLKSFQEQYPQTRFYSDVEKMFLESKPEATVIATPTTTHYAMAQSALLKGQHLLIEKPLALSVKECEDLTQLAQSQKRILMVGHTFLYNDAIVWLKKYLQDDKHAGRIFYLYAVRTNLGPIRQDVNALIDLAPHDIAVFLHLLGSKPTKVCAQGAAFLDHGREDVSFLTLYFEKGEIGHIQVSWLDPRKVRQTTVIGDKKMILFDDINLFEPIRIYDKGVRQEPREYRDFSEFKTVLYDGDVIIPKIVMGEPLKNQCKEFVQCVRENKTPLSVGAFATLVTRVLACAMESLKGKGQIIPLH